VCGRVGSGRVRSVVLVMMCGRVGSVVFVMMRKGGECCVCYDAEGWRVLCLL
jgi:hypothetical protein